MTPTSRDLARQLPDLPRWVEARDLLLSGECEIFGLQAAPELAFVVRDLDGEIAVVIGAPNEAIVRASAEGLRPGGLVIAPLEQAPWLIPALPGWTHTRVIVHSLRQPERLPVPQDGAVAFLDTARLDHLEAPADLLEELKSGAEHSPLAAAIVDGQPVAFCYAASETETLWDVAIDTLPEHRRRGYAGLCAAHMVRHMQAQGKQPVWAAVEENPASWRLAEKLGFAPVDELVLFERGKPGT